MGGQAAVVQTAGQLLAWTGKYLLRSCSEVSVEQGRVFLTPSSQTANNAAGPQMHE